jgi:hypothetical protein
MSMTPEAAALRQFAGDEFGGIKAFHGSPHSFDKFSMDKIGTGEGAQAYGHGLYFAENEGVARSYRDTLSRVDPALVQERLNDRFKTMADEWGVSVDELPDIVDISEERAAVMRELEREYAESVPGSMYEVNINADPADFLDWDKPLSEQPKKVRDVLGDGPETAAAKLSLAYKNPMHGGDLARMDRADPAQVSAAMKERGIPGIRFLDAGSRGAGEGSRNYVVFDENLIDIVRKYGIAGAAAMLGASQADVAQAMQQQRPQGLLSGPQ